MVIASKTPVSFAMERVLAFIAGTLAPQIAISTIAADITAVERVAGGEEWWVPRLTSARRLLGERRRAEEATRQICRIEAKKRHERNRRDHAERNRELAKLGGSAKQKK